MVQKRAGARFGVFDEKLAARLTPDLCMGTADDLAPERKLVGVLRVEGGDTCARAISESTDPQRVIALTDVARDRVELKGSVGVEMGDESDAEVFGTTRTLVCVGWGVCDSLP